MDVRIGVQYSAKELEVDLGDGVDAEAVQKEVEKILNEGTKMLWLTDKKGRKVGVPSAKVAYVEFGPVAADRRMGFIN